MKEAIRERTINVFDLVLGIGLSLDGYMAIGFNIKLCTSFRKNDQNSKRILTELSMRFENLLKTYSQ